MTTKKFTRTALLAVIAVLISIVCMATVSNAVAPGTVSTTVYFGDGFFCLHPDLAQPGAFGDPVEMTAVPLEEYTGYPKATIDIIAGYIMLQSDYYYYTGGESGGVVINNDDLQALIWNLVCTNPTHMSYSYHLQYVTDHELTNPEIIALKARRNAYNSYVLSHLDEVHDNYTLTIWVSPGTVAAGTKVYQDILELGLLEKHGVPSMEKKVLDRNDTDNTYDTLIGWQDAADHDIGDTVPFRLIATLRDMPSFSKYYLEFVDHMEHFDLIADSIRVYIDGNDVTDSFEIEKVVSGYTTDINVRCENILPLGAVNGSEVIMEYSAVLREDAIIGPDGNPNTAHLVYTRTSGTADKGETPPDTVKVFTYELIINKVKPDDSPLTGAAFKLSKKNPDSSYTEIGTLGANETSPGVYELTGENLTQFVWTGIDDGVYKLEEVVVPDGYNKMDDIEFLIEAVHDHTADSPHLYYLRTDYDNFDGFYDVELMGMYAHFPAGTTGYVDIMDKEGIITHIVNKPGSVLPSTGGNGTTVFYVIGIVVVLISGAAIITSVTKKARKA